MIYIVEDDNSVRKGLSRLMRSAGLPSQDFGSAVEFLAGVDASQPGCVLLDLTMPQMTGLQLQAELNKRHIELPVIAVSARDDSTTRNMARQLGASYFFRKPVDDQALIDAIQWVLTSKHPNPATH
jgi:FixJ family two-component response regulator